MNSQRRALLRSICSAPVVAVAATYSCNGSAQIQYISDKQRRAHSLFLLSEGGDQKAINTLRDLANGGDAWAALEYGYILQLGIGGVPINKIGARDAYLRAAPAGDGSREGLTLAAYNVGLMYLWGEAAPDGRVEISDAVKWLRVAALADAGGGGVLPAAMQLGVIYEQGYGRQPRNLPEAAKWYAIASRFGDPMAMYKHGRVLIEGEYVPRSPLEGIAALERAAERGSREAMYYLAAVYARGTEFLPRNDLQAAIWLLTASRAGTGRVDPAYASAVADAEARLKVVEVEHARKESARFARRYASRPPKVRYNTPLNMPVYFY